MTEAEWQTTSRPDGMEGPLWMHRPAGEERISVRKLGLVCVAFCRRLWPLLDEQSRKAVTLFEEFLDVCANLQTCGPVDLKFRQGEGAVEQYTQNPGNSTAAKFLARDAVWLMTYEVPMCIASGVYHCAAWAVAYSRMPSDQPHRMLDLCGDGSGVNFEVPLPPRADDEEQVQADLFREVYGNPFQRACLNPMVLSWHGGKITKTAQNIYHDRQWEEMPTLGKALMEGGCQDQEIIGHCRSQQPHVRGCWVLDLIL